MKRLILALDQGTTSSRAILFDKHCNSAGMAQQEIRQIMPTSGHVEHDPDEIWQTQLQVARESLTHGSVTANEIAAIGITNQRETTIVWDAETGSPVSNAIVWQSRISEPICQRLRAQQLESIIAERTGLLIDPYFSASKLTWLMESRPDLRKRADEGKLRFGTVDSYLIWRLTKGRSHVTDVSNASRTMLLNLETQAWDDELLKLFSIPRSMLPDVVDSSGEIGICDAEWFGAEIPICGCAGDQQAATFGQACFEPGTAKNTLGTGGFMLMNVGLSPTPSQNRLLSTIGWRINGQTTYCLEGSVFVAGALVQWLRDQLKVIESAPEISDLAQTANDSDGVVFVPAFVGLGAPHWDPHARGAILGLKRSTHAGHIAYAALEALALQNADLIEAMEADSGIKMNSIKFDGGASVNDLLMQIQSDVLNVPIHRPTIAETTALGAAFLAGLQVGVWNNLDEIAECWKLDKTYLPQMDEATRSTMRKRWQKAVARSTQWETD